MESSIFGHHHRWGFPYVGIVGYGATHMFGHCLGMGFPLCGYGATHMFGHCLGVELHHRTVRETLPNVRRDRGDRSTTPQREGETAVRGMEQETHRICGQARGMLFVMTSQQHYYCVCFLFF